MKHAIIEDIIGARNDRPGKLEVLRQKFVDKCDTAMKEKDFVLAQKLLNWTDERFYVMPAKRERDFKQRGTMRFGKYDFIRQIQASDDHERLTYADTELLLNDTKFHKLMDRVQYNAGRCAKAGFPGLDMEYLKFASNTDLKKSNQYGSTSKLRQS